MSFILDRRGDSEYQEVTLVVSRDKVTSLGDLLEAFKTANIKLSENVKDPQKLDLTIQFRKLFGRENPSSERLYETFSRMQSLRNDDAVVHIPGKGRFVFFTVNACVAM